MDKIKVQVNKFPSTGKIEARIIRYDSRENDKRRFVLDNEGNWVYLSSVYPIPDSCKHPIDGDCIREYYEEAKYAGKTCPWSIVSDIKIEWLDQFKEFAWSISYIDGRKVSSMDTYLPIVIERISNIISGETIILKGGSNESQT